VRLVVEKPFGTDLAGARALNAELLARVEEGCLYRIDHYLGKETVQNLMAMRFANALFEPVWNARHIDHVQITVAENVGVEGRGGYYDRSGAMRDMVQNHMLQLLCLTAMEPPYRFEADAVRDEKLKVLRALRPRRRPRTRRGVSTRPARRGRVSGGCGAGGVLHRHLRRAARACGQLALERHALLPAHRQAPARAAVGDRHAVPRGAARDLPRQRRARGRTPCASACSRTRASAGDDGQGPRPRRHAPGARLAGHDLRRAAAAQGLGMPDAYERLLMDVIRGDQTLFMRGDEVEAAWAWVDPILAAWEDMEPPEPYDVGSSGPEGALRLIHADGRRWREIAA
jgi:glucose-6-phosphate 1-dehydrogenase